MEHSECTVNINRQHRFSLDKFGTEYRPHAPTLNCEKKFPGSVLTSADCISRNGSDDSVGVSCGSGDTDCVCGDTDGVCYGSGYTVRE